MTQRQLLGRRSHRRNDGNAGGACPIGFHPASLTVAPREKGCPMDWEQLAKEIADSLARHQSRGLVDSAGGMTNVVIHGRADLLAVANDVLEASIAQLKPARTSWGGWFVVRANRRRRLLQDERERQELADRLENDAVSAAIARLKIRVIES